MLPFRRWDETLELMDYTDSLDPRNKRTDGLRSYVLRVRELTAETGRLEAKRKAANGKLDDNDTVALARCYSDMGRVREAAAMLEPVAGRISDPAALRFMSIVFMDAKMSDAAENALNRYLKANPSSDVDAWLDLARLQHRAGKRQAAQQSFVAGYRIDKENVFARLQRDKELYEIAAPLFKRR